MDELRSEFSPAILSEIRRLISAHGTLVHAAGETGINYATLKQWLGGHRKSLSAENLSRLSAAYPELATALSKGLAVSIHDYQRRGGRTRVQNLNNAELAVRMAEVRRHKQDKTELPPMDASGSLEFYGAMMGDGCISCYYSKYDRCQRRDVILYGNSLKDGPYFRYLRRLAFRLFKAESYLKQVPKRHTLVLTIRNRKIADWLARNGFPTGVKGKLRIPKRIQSLPFSRLRFLLRGFFDTDGSISARKGEGYRYPHVFLSTASAPLRRQFMKILSNQGYPVWETRKDVVFRGMAATKKWFKEVGSSNPRNKERYKRWLRTKRLDH